MVRAHTAMHYKMMDFYNPMAQKLNFGAGGFFLLAHLYYGWCPVPMDKQTGKKKSG